MFVNNRCMITNCLKKYTCFKTADFWAFGGLQNIESEIITNSTFRKSILNYTEFWIWFFYCKLDASRMGVHRCWNKFVAQLLGQWVLPMKTSEKVYKRFTLFENYELQISGGQIQDCFTPKASFAMTQFFCGSNPTQTHSPSPCRFCLRQTCCNPARCWFFLWAFQTGGQD